MRNKSFFDCLMLVGTAFSVRNTPKLTAIGRLSSFKEEPAATIVNLSFILQDFQIVNGKNMEFEVLGLLNQKWIDHRVAENLNNTRRMAVAGQIWKPKVTNCNGYRKEDNRLEDYTFWRGYPDGSVLLSEKLVLRGRCTKNFQKFPFDTQICDLQFCSYLFPLEEILLNWDPTETLISKHLFDLSEFVLTDSSLNIFVETRVSGNFSVAVIKFIVQRRSSHYLFCVAIPLVLSVGFNYLSLWMDIFTEMKNRLYINLLLVLINLFYNYISICVLQPTSYLKALDIFVFMCTGFLVFTLFETFLVLNTLNKRKDKHYKISINKDSNHVKLIYWIELFLKIAYPTFYVLFVTLFGIAYV